MNKGERVRRVERLRDEYRTLSALPSPDSTDAARLEAVTAEDVRAAARRWLVDRGKVVMTLVEQAG